jgi:hypothetical protein
MHVSTCPLVVIVRPRDEEHLTACLHLLDLQLL